MQIDPIHSLIAEDMRSVDVLIRRRLESDVVLIRQIAEYIIGSGGKRLRPAVVILAARAFGYGGYAHHELAAVVEFIHTATLLHDDVVDESELRRGRRTSNAEFGNPASVLVGDFLYSRAFQMMVGVNDMEVMSVLADATNAIAEGEVMQLLNTRNPDISEDEYLQVIHRKTARLFQAAAQLGAILGAAGTDDRWRIGQFGLHLGTAFQLIDDVLDYSGDVTETGKNLGDDLNEGKPTLPLIHVLRHGSTDQSQAVRVAIENGGRSGFDAVLSAIQANGSLDYVRGRARHEADSALRLLEPVRPSAFRDGLAALAEFAVQRRY